MDPETEFDTDTMILDYVCSKATHALLLTRIAELSNRPAHADVDILEIFDSMSSNYSISIFWVGNVCMY